TDFALLLEEFYHAASFTKLMPKYVNAYMKVAATYPSVAGAAIGTVLAYLHTEPVLELPPLYVVRPSEAELKVVMAVKEKEIKEREMQKGRNKIGEQELKEAARREALKTLTADSQNRVRRFYVIPDL